MTHSLTKFWHHLWFAIASFPFTRVSFIFRRKKIKKKVIYFANNGIWIYYNSHFSCQCNVVWKDSLLYFSQVFFFNCLYYSFLAGTDHKGKGNSTSTLKEKKVNLDCFISHSSIHLPVFPVNSLEIWVNLTPIYNSQCVYNPQAFL